MKKFFTFALASLLLIGLVGHAEARWDKYDISVYAWRGSGIPSQLHSLELRNGLDSSGSAEAQITYKVLYRNTNTAASIASNFIGTSKTNPVTTTVYSTAGNRSIRFWIDRNDSNYTATSGVDIIVTDVRGGYSLFLDDVRAAKTHTAVIDERPNVSHVGTIWWSSQSGVVDTGVDFESYTRIEKVLVEIVTGISRTGPAAPPAGTAEIDVGLLSTETGGDNDGFIRNARIHVKPDGTVGFVDMNATSALSGGLTRTTGWTTPSGVEFDDGYYHGALFRKSTSPGSREHIIWNASSVAKSLVYQTAGNGGAGYLHYVFSRMR